jgi:hypothetical protein
MLVAYFREILAFNDALPQFKEMNTTVLGGLLTFYDLSARAHFATMAQASPRIPNTLISRGQYNLASRGGSVPTSNSP